MLLFHTGVHENYHRTSDTPDKLNAPGMSRVVRLAFCVVERIGRAARAARLSRKSPSARTSGRKRSLPSKARSRLPGWALRLDPADKSDRAGRADREDRSRFARLARGLESGRSDSRIRRAVK